MNRHYKTAMAILCLCMAAGNARGDWFLDLSSELTANDNVTRAELDADIRSDNSLSMTAEAGYFTQVATYTGLTFSAEISHASFHHYNGLDNNAVGAGIALNHKFGIGERVPRLNVRAGVSRDRYDKAVRDADSRTGSVSLSKRMTTALEWSAGVTYLDRRADYASFNIESWALFTRAWFDISYRDWLSAGYEYRNGSIVSTGRRSLRLWEASNGIADRDTAFPEAPLYAYPVDALVHTLSADWNRAVMETGTVYLGLEHRRSSATHGIEYNTTIFRGGLLYSFDL